MLYTIEENLITFTLFVEIFVLTLKIVCPSNVVNI